ncbi:MAG: PD40 domain-containing protein [Bacteroidetes bacterium]|nr:PD40 domain-containing protein [Bacteroidota bacterium]
MSITTNGVSSQPSWSPDGNQLVFISDGDLWFKDVPDIVD